MSAESITARGEAKSPSHRTAPIHGKHENGVENDYARERGVMRTLRSAVSLWGRTSIPFFRAE